MGCDWLLSAAAAKAAISTSVKRARLATHTTSVTSGTPRVSVPVLSKTMVSASASRSRKVAPLTRTPARAARVIAASAAVGTATRTPVPKSVMRTLVSRSIIPDAAQAAPAMPKVGSTRRSA